MTSVTFRTAFCTRHRCPEAAFEQRFFWRALYRHALPLAILIRWLSPTFFRADTEFLEWLGRAVCLEEVHEDLNSFEYGNRVTPHWLRTGFLIRLSVSRVKVLAQQYLQP